MIHLIRKIIDSCNKFRGEEFRNIHRNIIKGAQLRVRDVSTLKKLRDFF